MKWTAACGTNRGLTEENFYFLATKAFRNTHTIHPRIYVDHVDAHFVLSRGAKPNNNVASVLFVYTWGER